MQKLITARTRMEFEDEVNKLLVRDWKVVPGTITIQEQGNYQDNNYIGCFCIVLELEFNESAKNISDFVQEIEKKRNE